MWVAEYRGCNIGFRVGIAVGTGHRSKNGGCRVDIDMLVLGTELRGCNIRCMALTLKKKLKIFTNQPISIHINHIFY